MRFRKKPVVIEAMQLTYENVEEVAAWCDADWDSWSIRIETMEGVMEADCEREDWIIKGVAGEFHRYWFERRAWLPFAIGAQLAHLGTHPGTGWWGTLGSATYLFAVGIVAANAAVDISRGVKDWWHRV